MSLVGSSVTRMHPAALRLRQAFKKLRRLRPRHLLVALNLGWGVVRDYRSRLRAPIETDTDPTSLARLLNVVHRAWARHAESDPHLSILTRPLAKNGTPLYQGALTPELVERF